MVVRISRWGNSLGIRLPKDVLDQAHLREGDVVDVVPEDGFIALKSHDAELTLDQLIDMITAENVHSETYGTIVGAESW